MARADYTYGVGRTTRNTKYPCLMGISKRITQSAKNRHADNVMRANHGKGLQHTSGDTRIFSQLHPPLLINEHKNPSGIENPKFQYFFNSVLQLIFSIFRNNRYTPHFNSSTEGTLLKCFVFHTAHNARHSKDMDALKFQIVRHDTFYNGQNQLLILMNIIHKGSLPDSNSTTYTMGASLSDILFSFVLEKYIVCDACGLRSPSFESSSVLYIFTYWYRSYAKTSFYKDCNRNCKNSGSRCNKKSWHVESSYILQPPKYLLLFVNRFRYINDNVTKDRCSIPMDTTVRPVPLKFSLRATTDHHGPSIYSGHYTASINCCQTHSFTTITQLRFGVIDSKNSSTAYVTFYELIYTWFLNSEQEGGIWSLPSRWHILSIPLTTCRGTGAKTCGLDDVFPPDDLCSSPEALC